MSEASASLPQTVLVTGGRGFLGRAVARRFKALGCRVLGIGHGSWEADQAREHGFDLWRESDVSLEGLSTITETFGAVVHCAGNGSVALTLKQPFDAFLRTVQATAQLLEHLRRVGSAAVVIYPSSAAVYGTADDHPLPETHASNPVSPYGHYKRIDEDLLECYSRHFGIRVGIIRFFSIYGPGLRKQLLWDAAARLSSGERRAVFSGTGGETRDWIHMDDAAELVVQVARSPGFFSVVNGAGGERVTVDEVLQMLRRALGVQTDIAFDGTVRAGDPRHYHADLTVARRLGWRPEVSLAQGLDAYATWFRAAWPR